jgi:hypothetical protein
MQSLPRVVGPYNWIESKDRQLWVEIVKHAVNKYDDVLMV